MSEPYAGTTFSIDVAMKDGVTKAPIDAALVTDAWAYLGGIEYVHPCAEISMVGTTFTLNVPASATVSLSGLQPLVIKLKLTNGTLDYIADTRVNMALTFLNTRGI